jgi:lactobin A/cerein 7B family class IIb bacteriocin
LKEEIKMQEMTMDEVEQVNGGILPLLAIAAAALLSGCATTHGPNQSNLVRD